MIDQICLIHSSSHYELSIVQKYVPLVASFLSKCYRENENHIPPLVQALIGDIIEHMVAPNTMPRAQLISLFTSSRRFT